MGSSGDVGHRVTSMLMTHSSTSPFHLPQWMLYCPFSAAWRLLEWMQSNGLRLNPDKMEVLRVGGSSISGLGDSLSFGGTTLTTKSGVRSLGIHLDPALTMETQVAFMARSAYFHL